MGPKHQHPSRRLPRWVELMRRAVEDEGGSPAWSCALAVDLMGKRCGCLLSPALALGDLGTLGLVNNGAPVPLRASFSPFNNSRVPVVEALHKTSASPES